MNVENDAARLPDVTEHALREGLPEAVRHRVRGLVSRAPRTTARAGSFVLYWMRMAVRDHENPALDAAVHAANALGIPVLVYHAVSERYPYASDRHHTFILEGARDVAAGLAERSIAYVLHIERPGARGPVLAELASRASLVVTEDVPVPPLDAWTVRLSEKLAAANVAMWAVDASCVVPMPLVSTRYDRAYAFRTASRKLASAALRTAWHDVVPAVPLDWKRLALPFEPVNAHALTDRAIADFVAMCRIDHAVGAVRAERGGSRAGYARWNAFRSRGLANYARDRNDPLRVGTSRMSAYLHYGHVSPLRIARESTLETGPGADKFLDELLVWREVAWHYASRTPMGELHSLEALPAWARATLEAHAHDARDVLPIETLERGRTGDALWDAAQRSLLAHGELHNNVRMTWGKALPFWTSSPEEARRALVELNHRYALDGRDPASYGGLYYSLGLFDRPFATDQPVLGTVRTRPSSAHAERLDVPAYARHVARKTRTMPGRVAIIGAGFSGLACARVLADHNVDVTVFDKGRAMGGRLATRRHEAHTFDLGAQYFTARDERFRRWVRSWLELGICAPWHGRIHAFAADGGAGTYERTNTPPTERLVGVPSMNALARHLASGLPIKTSHRVDVIERVKTGTNRETGTELELLGVVAPPGTTLRPKAYDLPDAAQVALGVFDVVLTSAPAVQACELLAPVSPRLANDLRTITFEPCLALGFVADDRDDDLRALEFDGAFVGRPEDRDQQMRPTRSPSKLTWVARDSSKPGRPAGERWVLHATAAWSRASLTAPTEVVTTELLSEFARVTNVAPFSPSFTTLQRWHFARASAPHDAEHPALFDEDACVGACGDWSSGGRVEGAFLAGVALAGRVLGMSGSME